MEAAVTKLRKKITTIPPEVLKSLPEAERSNFANYKAVPIELLVKADWNYKMEDEFKSAQLLNNVKRNGQIENIHIRELETGYYEVVNGNHRLDQYKEAGVTFAWCYDHGRISVEQAQRIAIETNETKFDTDTVRLAKLIKEMRNAFPEDDLKTTLPFTEEELVNFDKLLDFDWNQFEPKQGEGEVSSKIEIIVSGKMKELWDVQMTTLKKDKVVDIENGDDLAKYILNCMGVDASMEEKGEEKDNEPEKGSET